VELAVNVIGVGVDLVDLDRIARLLANRGDQAMQRFFTDEERAYLATRPEATGHAAARIAAKEAVYKALQSLPGARAVGWRDIEVCRDGEGRPTIRLHGIAAELTAGIEDFRIHLSLSHTHTAAVGMAVLEGGRAGAR
jgi:holo-[acyl-carrier protein] synthase